MKKKVMVALASFCLLVGAIVCLISSFVPYKKFAVSADLTAIIGIILMVSSILFLFYADFIKK